MDDIIVTTPPACRGSSASLTQDLAQAAVEYAQQAERLSHQQPSGPAPSVALHALFVTPQDPVIVTTDGNRLPGVPLREAHKLNDLRQELENKAAKGAAHATNAIGQAHDREAGTARCEPSTTQEPRPLVACDASAQAHTSTGETLRQSMPPSHTNPLFPPLPLYGPPSLLRNLQCYFFRMSSFCLSLAFLAAIVLGALFTSIPDLVRDLLSGLSLRHSRRKDRPFWREERRRAESRSRRQREWAPRSSADGALADDDVATANYPPTEGGKDPLVCDVGYYARRVGLDVETYTVQTEDGFLLDLWHVFNPKERRKADEQRRGHRGPAVFQVLQNERCRPAGGSRFPVLLIHGLLQSSGAYCCNDDASLAFWLCKSGFDVWLGNNRCGFTPRHSILQYGDPRMWCWNIRQMGVFDLPALTCRVLLETGFPKLGLVCHSQGTTEAFVALAKEQRPDLGEKLTVFCALAPAAYAGPLIGKMYFKFMRIISPSFFRLMFGIHAFIPFMLQMHSLLHPKIYGWLGYKVFSFLFDWSDRRWDRALRDRMFQFAPVYVSAESMRWWLGRECFAKHKCILATREATKAEEKMENTGSGSDDSMEPAKGKKSARTLHDPTKDASHTGVTAWYNEQVPPMALWVCGNDDLVDGRRLLRRFGRGREPHVKIVHSKVIDEYEHLDVIWAVDAVDQVFKELREVLWKTCDVREVCRIPDGCEDIEPWKPEMACAVKDDGHRRSNDFMDAERKRTGEVLL